MKTKKSIIIIIASILVLFLSVITFATDELANEPKEIQQSEQTQVEENTNNKQNNKSQEDTNNQNETLLHGTEVKNTVPNTQAENNQEVETTSETTNRENYSTNYTTIHDSDNANLGSLTLDVEGISPEFNKNTTEYYLIVDMSVENIKVIATAEDTQATVLITGNTELKEGENTIYITVEAENGSTKIYVIHVTKTDNIELTNANLKTLEIKGFNIYPNFKSNIYSYNLIINEQISQLEIFAEPENEQAKIEITGNENLKEGDNSIKITVTAQNGETTKEYKINAFITTKKIDIVNNKNEGIIILCILFVGIIITLVKMIKKSA